MTGLRGGSAWRAGADVVLSVIAERRDVVRANALRAKTRAGGCCQVRAESGKARGPSTVASQPALRRRLVVHVSPRPSACDGDIIERGRKVSFVTS